MPNRTSRPAPRAREVRILRNERDFAAAIAELTVRCRHMRALHARNGLPPLRELSADFEGLARIVTGQQLSAQSAAAIWGRVSAAIQPFEAERVLSSSEPELKALGLSAGKIRTLRALAAAVVAKDLEFAALNEQKAEDICAALTALHGIGPWTADIYLLFALRRADAFPPGDLALQLAAQRLFRLKEKPGASELLVLAERWRPLRGAAARLLWAEYARTRSPGKQKASREKRAKA